MCTPPRPPGGGRGSDAACAPRIRDRTRTGRAERTRRLRPSTRRGSGAGLRHELREERATAKKRGSGREGNRRGGSRSARTADRGSGASAAPAPSGADSEAFRVAGPRLRAWPASVAPRARRACHHGKKHGARSCGAPAAPSHGGAGGARAAPAVPRVPRPRRGAGALCESRGGTCSARGGDACAERAARRQCGALQPPWARQR